MEIRSILKNNGTILIKEHYRTISPEYLCRFFRTLFAILDTNDFGYFDEIPTDRIFAFLSDEDEFPIQVLQHILKSYSHQEDGASSFRLDCQKICRFFASELFKIKKTWGGKEFLEAWNKAAGGLCPSLEILRGLATVDQSSSGDSDVVVTSFPISALPLDSSERFQMLFQAKSRWDLSAIEVYVEDAAKVQGLETIDLLLKHARITVDPKTQTKIVTALIPS